MPAPDKTHALDHIVVVLFENRSLDNLLGHLYGPDDGKTFDGVIGKDLSNPIPEWAEHGAERRVVPYTVATDMDSPNPDSGEEWYHTNTQLFNVLDNHNRFKIGEAVTEPWNAPPPGATPTMDGFVTDYISTFTGEIGRQPTYDEYAHIMTGCTPEQLPVLNGIARDFGVFDHWFCEVPSQTFMNRSFWTAATSSGFAVNSPMTKWFTGNDAETLFERLEAHGKTWKVYIMEPMPVSFTGMIHFSRLKDRLATHFVPFAEFEKDAAAGTLPDFSLIEPNMAGGHGDYHPAFGRSFSDSVDLAMDNPSSMLAGEAFLERVFTAYRSATSETGTNVWNTPLLIGWDEPGGTYDHVPPGPVPPPDPAAPPGEFGFTFDRSGYRVPAILVSPWVEPGSVYNEEYRHTSLIATLRRTWDLGEALTRRDAAARTFDHLLARETPRDPHDWVTVTARPVPEWMMDLEVVGRALSTLGKGMAPALIARARQVGVPLPPELDAPGADLPPERIVGLLRQISAHFFPLLANPSDPEPHSAS
ncbi:alkaline phosphatase family protein [Kribbella sp. NPDC049227]|uniref:alkaline phosphatase family protein n=1 Tax=Kribbella sp. NPDC049227 TaxID=3364113 RepID=UPI00371D808B